MSNDEQEIRQLVATWQNASRAGDTATMLSLMTDDAVFLLPGCKPLGKADFAAASNALNGENQPTMDGVCSIQEIQISGHWAFMWTELAIAIIPADGSAPSMRAGHTLSVLKKVNGKWLLSRDANMLTPARVPAKAAA